MIPGLVILGGSWLVLGLVFCVAWRWIKKGLVNL